MIAFRASMILVALFGAAAASAADSDANCQRPFRAEYVAYRNGSEAGRTTLQLVDHGDGTATLTSETRGTAGLARLAGVHVLETSKFRWKNGRPEALAYDYSQESAFRDRVRHAAFDWNAGEVRVREGKDDFRYAIVPGLIDRQSVTLAIVCDLAADQRAGTERAAFDYAVAVKDRVETMRYARLRVERVDTPAGPQQALRVERQGEPGNDRKRVARSWFSPSRGFLPVQIEQSEKGGDTITLKLAR